MTNIVFVKRKDPSSDQTTRAKHSLYTALVSKSSQLGNKAEAEARANPLAYKLTQKATGVENNANPSIPSSISMHACYCTHAFNGLF
jgi:hypothetical protein